MNFIWQVTTELLDCDIIGLKLLSAGAVKEGFRKSVVEVVSASIYLWASIGNCLRWDLLH
jgi:hypothetical protein